MKRLLALFLFSLIALSSAVAQVPDTAGEVTKIDKTQAKVTLRHGEIKSLEMPAMTMAYRVRDPRMLDGLSVGDKVRFAAEKVGGNFTVVALVKAP